MKNLTVGLKKLVILIIINEFKGFHNKQNLSKKDIKSRQTLEKSTAWSQPEKYTNISFSENFNSYFIKEDK